MKLTVAFPDFLKTTLFSIGRERNSSECNFTAQQHAEEVMKWHKYQEDSDMIEGAASGRL
jgi:phage gp46-like protein